MNAEWAARALVVALALVTPVAMIWLHTPSTQPHVHVVATMPEKGGWSPEHLTARTGVPLRLELTSNDVVHGIAIGRDDRPPVDVTPGRLTRLGLLFDRPGTYTFYCTRWCGPNHWRMRGTIEVTGPGETVEAPKEAPYMRLGIDLDAPHPPAVQPHVNPSARRGAAWGHLVPRPYLAADSLLARSPVSVLQQIRQLESFDIATDDELWDVVAWIWRQHTTDTALERGRELYTANCSACHGEIGDGRGVLAESLGADRSGRMSGHNTVGPADFTDRALLGATPALLHGKIVRGGMGTGMPYWGPIFSAPQLQALVDYVWSFQFDYSSALQESAKQDDTIDDR